MVPPQNTTETTETETLVQFRFYLTSRISIMYEITQTSAFQMATLVMRQKA